MIGIVTIFLLLLSLHVDLYSVYVNVYVYIYIYMHMNIRSMLPYIIHVLTQHQQKQSWSAAVTHDGADGHTKVNHFLPRGIPGDPRGIPGGSQGPSLEKDLLSAQLRV